MTVFAIDNETVESLTARWKALRPNQRAIAKVLLLQHYQAETARLVTYGSVPDIAQLIKDNAESSEVAFLLLSALSGSDK